MPEIENAPITTTAPTAETAPATPAPAASVSKSKSKAAATPVKDTKPLINSTGITTSASGADIDDAFYASLEAELLAEQAENAVKGEVTPAQTAPEAEKPTPKAVADAVSRATAKLRRQLDEANARDERARALLREAGFEGDIEDAAARMLASSKNITLDAAKARLSTSRDAEILGTSDAQRIIDTSDGIEEIVAKLDALRSKPIATRTPRDKACFEALALHYRETSELNELAAAGISPETVKGDSAFQAFASKLSPKLTLAQKYDFYREVTGKKAPSAATPPPALTRETKPADPDFYTPDMIDRLDMDKVDDKTLDKILESMEKWK